MPAPEAEPAVTLRISLPRALGAAVDFVESTHALQESLSDVKEALAASQLNAVTNYSLVYRGRKVSDEYDDFEPLSAVFGVADTPAEPLAVSLVPRAYTLGLVYDHLVRFREAIGMNFHDHAARSWAVGQGSGKFHALGVNASTAPESGPEGEAAAGAEPAQKSLSDADRAAETSLSDADRAAVAAAVAPAPRGLAQHAAADALLAAWALPVKALSLSQWSVPAQQRAKGDLLYLTLTTLESETYSITCHVSGFFVSRMASAHFDPAPKATDKAAAPREYVLYNLVARLSPQFAATMARNKERLYAQAQFAESYLTPAQAVARFSWAVAGGAGQSVADASRAQLAAFAHGVDGADVVKDWNDEFQGIKEFPRGTLNERLLRDKLLNKYIQEFNHAAVATALDIVRGSVAPLNPNEPRDKHIYLRNNIFYSYGVNATGAHDGAGGDEAARYCFAKDVAAVRLLNRIDADGLCNLLTCVVDYMGVRVVCQAPVPGVFADQTDAAGNPVDKVAYGYAMDDDRINADERFDAALRPVAEAFHLKRHAVELASGARSPADLAVSKDTKGIVGSDGRKYVIDLYRATPLDIAFVDAHCDGSAAAYPHREASLRHEAVDEWHKRKAAAIFKVETEKLEKEGKLAAEGKPQVAIPFDQITFNPDAFTGVNESQEDRNTVREMSDFVSKNLVPEFLDDIARNSVPYDGAQLADYMHKMGINMRYLGHLATESLVKVEEFEASIAKTAAANEALRAERQAAAEKAEKERLEKEQADKAEKADKAGEADAAEAAEPANKADEAETAEKDADSERATAAQPIPVVANMKAFHTVCVQEMVARAVKHVLRKQAAAVPAVLMPFLVAHFHNCLLGTDVNASPAVEIDDSLSSLFVEEELAFQQLTPASVQDLVAREVHLRYRYTLAGDWVAALKPLPLVREIALKFGIQWKAQDYNFSKDEFAKATATATATAMPAPVTGKKGKKKAPVVVAAPRKTVFVADDIITFVPIVKDSSYRCTFVDDVFETAKIQLHEGEKQVGLNLLAELVSFYQQIYGSVHDETARFYSTLAHMYAECQMPAEAAIVARKALILQERLTGVDSYETINAYVKASYFDTLNNDIVSGFKLNAKAMADWTVVYGADHPNTINTLSNFGASLQDLKMNNEAKKLFGSALDYSLRLNGELSDITAVIRHRLAILLVQSNEFKAAEEHFRKASDSFNKLLGPDDPLSKESTTFAINLGRYIVAMEQQAKEKKKKQPAPKPKKAPSPPKKEEKKPAVNDIATKSVDEILRFIEGK